ncbi:MAG: hydrolase [Acidobacteriota bacterium]
MPAKPLPARPNLDQYKKQAKDLAKACTAAEPDALDRVRSHHPRYRDLAAPDLLRISVKLADAQLTIAREHAFETWAHFSQHLNSLPQNPPAVEQDLSPSIPADGVHLNADISGWQGATALVLFWHASGSSRFLPNHRYLAHELQQASLCCIHVDLMTEDEELADRHEALQLDIRRLGKRIAAATDWIAQQPNLRGLLMGSLGSGPAAAAAVFAAAERPGLIRAIASCGGRPDLAGPWMWKIQVPMLFVVAAKDTVALGFTSALMAPLPNVANRTLAVIDGAHQVFQDEAALQRTAALTRDWFRRHLTS